jgi:hypothetical protein
VVLALDKSEFLHRFASKPSIPLYTDRAFLSRQKRFHPPVMVSRSEPSPGEAAVRTRHIRAGNGRFARGFFGCGL